MQRSILQASRNWFRNAATHLVDAIRWHASAEIEIGAGVVACLGFVGPILLAALFGQISLGIAASTGSLLVDGFVVGRTLGAQLKTLALRLAPAFLAMIIATALAASPTYSNAAVVLVSAFAATIGGYSRDMAIATTRFTLFVIITLSVATTTSHHAALVVLLAMAALWTAALWILFGFAIRRVRPLTDEEPELPQISRADRSRRWLNSLRTIAGWRYTMRLSGCLAVAEAINIAWPQHHFHWIALTVAILTQRTVSSEVKLIQRVLGAFVGAIGAVVFLAVNPSAWLLTLGIGLIAAARPLLKSRHYLSYTALMTTLIVLMADVGVRSTTDLLVDRVVATMIGAALVIVVDTIVSRLTPSRLP
ncbi:MAG TPA: FUSC family protein [Rhodoblastus sp.]|nr:FUSC family protein [Rhodoblastus sp.]